MGQIEVPVLKLCRGLVGHHDADTKLARMRKEGCQGAAGKFLELIDKDPGMGKRTIMVFQGQISKSLLAALMSKACNLPGRGGLAHRQAEEVNHFAMPCAGARSMLWGINT